MFSRRSLLGSVLGGLAVASTAKLAWTQNISKLPNSDLFESGDFLWPKTPGAFIPYRYTSDDAESEDRRRWEEEKEHFLNRVDKGEVPNGQSIAEEIRYLSYQDFRALYLRGQAVDQIVPYSGGRIGAVGHVGIVELDEHNQPWVIEALWESGVVRRPYSSWINDRPGQIVWHGRLKNFGAKERSGIAAEAKKYTSKPYDFWNFDLADTSGFYCSKLVWFSTMSALDIAVDGNRNPSRSIWLSPKQILYSSAVDRIFDPGPYATE